MGSEQGGRGSRTLAVFGRSQRVVAARIRRAMAAGQLELFCQPTVDCLTGRIDAAESLIRWRHRSNLLIPPGEWIAAVEGSPLRNAFNLHVLRLALREREAWLRCGVDLPVTVNVTPSCLADDRFVAAVVELFADHPPADAVRLEITERTTVINSDALKANVEYLTERGFQFLLDDFGAGYSSMIRLANLPVASLKIDGSLVAKVRERRLHCSIVDALNELAHTLGLAVIAEGVEDSATWLVLQDLGCDRIQGFHVARPMPAAAFPRFVRDYQPLPPRTERRVGGDRRVQGERRTLGVPA